MLGVRELPVRVFVEPDTNVLLARQHERWFHAAAGCLRRSRDAALGEQTLTLNVFASIRQ